MPRLKLLGGAVLEREGDVVTGPAARRHPLALLALLALAPSRRLGRSRLVGYLWPESTEAAARNRLNTCVYNVRKALGPEALVSVGGDLRLDADRVTTDVALFLEALEAGDAERAAGLYAGPFMDGFHLSGAPEFEKWLDRERASLQQRYHEALERLATAAEDRGDREGAVRRWRQLVAADPWDGRATLQLMRALDAAGSTAAALRVAREHAERLAEELGTEPRREVLELAARIRTAREEASRRPSARERLAVLPFETVGPEPVEGFTDGVHLDLLNRLSGLGDVAVISRASVMRYRDGEIPSTVIRRELGADWVLHGSVRASASRVRVDARLVDAREDRQVWGEGYHVEPTAEDLFDVQARIAGEIAAALVTRLTPSERRAVAGRPTTDLEAHRLYVQGRGHLDERTEAGLRQAARYFQAAIQLDPEYALAWSGLADAFSLMDFYDHPRPEGVPGPLDAARRALAADPSCGEAHASLGIQRALARDGPGALRSLERAIELRPSHAEAYAWLGWTLLLTGRPDEALAPAIRAVEIDPLAPAYRVYLAEVRLAMGQGERALAETRRAAGIQPGYGLARFMEALVLYHLGRHEEAWSALEGSLEAVPPGGSPKHSEIRVLAALSREVGGEPGAVRAELRRMEGTVGRSTAAHPFSVGMLHAALGETDAAFEAFGRVSAWREFAIEYLRYFFPDVLGPLRNDRRFDALVRRADRAWDLDAPLTLKTP